jgi:type II secretory pathway pseudopilin PulG
VVVSSHAGGFTYVGVLIFVAILALASAATLHAGSAMQQRAQEEELLFVGGEFARAFRSYFLATPAGQRPFPATLEELIRDPRYPGVRRHLRKVYVDPMTGKAEWGMVVVPGGVIGVHSLSTQAPLKVDAFEPEFKALAGRKRYAEWAFGFLPPGIAPPANVMLAGAPAVLELILQKPGAPLDKPAPAAPSPGIGPGASSK